MWPETADLVTFTEEILNGKLHFLCSGCGNGEKPEDEQDESKLP